MCYNTLLLPIFSPISQLQILRVFLLEGDIGNGENIKKFLIYMPVF